MLYSLCSGVGPVPTVLVSSIRSCPGRLASVSPYVTHIHIEKRAIDKSDKAIFHFPFLSIVRLWCVTNLLSTFSGLSYDIEDSQQSPPVSARPTAS